MESCDCCGKYVDERSMQIIDNYFVCRNCYHYYTLEELKDKIKEEERKSNEYS